MLRNALGAALLIFASSFFATPAAAIEVGDVAPEIVVEEWANADLSPRKLKGRLIFYEMFRTW